MLVLPLVIFKFGFELPCVLQLRGPFCAACWLCIHFTASAYSPFVLCFPAHHKRSLLLQIAFMPSPGSLGFFLLNQTITPMLNILESCYF